MNPMIDLGMWLVVVAACIGLYFEIPRATREIKKILEEWDNM